MPQSKGKKIPSSSAASTPPPLPAALQAHEPTAQDVADALALLAADPSLQESPSPPLDPVPSLPPSSPSIVPTSTKPQKDIVPEKGVRASAARFGSERIPSLGAGRASSRHREDSPSQGTRRRFTPNTAEQPCVYFRNKECRFGDKCRYSHDPALFPSAAPSSSAPQDKEALHDKDEEDKAPGAGSISKDCVYWLGGTCRWGDICRYQHPEGKQGSQPDLRSSFPLSKRTNGGSQTGKTRSFRSPVTSSSTSSSPSRGKIGKGDGSKMNGRRKKGQDHKEDRGSGESRKSPEICRYWKSARPCLWADECHFRHAGPQTPAPPSLQDFFTSQLTDPSELAELNAMMEALSGYGDLESLQRELNNPSQGLPGDLDNEDDADEDEGGIMGFTADEVMELLSQGVKPWDDDAHAVLDALSGDYGYDDDDDDYYY